MYDNLPPSSLIHVSVIFHSIWLGSLSFRIEAAHPELCDQHLKDQPGAGASTYPDVEDDDADPNYARIKSFKDQRMGPAPQLPPHSPPYSAVQQAQARTPSPQGPTPFIGHGGSGSDPAAAANGDSVDRLYAKVNKPRGAGPAYPSVSASANDR